MKRRTTVIIFIMCVVIIILLAIFVYSYYKFINSQDEYLLNETFTVANWNLQIFGDKKANDTELMNLYAGKISKYDVVFIQEIRDKDGSAFDKLCSMLPDYDCDISSRAGRSSSKEQYGVIYLKKFNIEITDYNPDALDRWERPPSRADLHYKNYSVSMYTIHAKPSNVSIELENLETLINSEFNQRNILLIGDLNADCNYYNRYSESDFSDWYWVISDDADTTSGSSNCAYDRILLNNDASKEFISAGIDFSEINTDVSDHYIVWALLRDYDYEKDKTFKGYIQYLIG